MPDYLRGPGHAEDAPFLLLAAHALVVVLDAAPGGGVVSAWEMPSLGELLEEERRHWHRVAERPEHRLTVSEVARERAMAALVLLGADSEEEALAVVSRVPELRDTSTDERGKVVRWANALYPGPRRFTPHFRPDLIASWFLIGQVRDSPAFARAVRADLDRAQAAHALRWLGYAADHLPDGVAVFLEVVAVDLFHLAPTAVAALTDAMSSRRQLEERLGGLIAQAQWSQEDLDRLEEALPPRQMIAVDIGIQYARIDYIRRNGDRDDLATSLSNLGTYFSALRRPAEPLPPPQEAVAIYRELAQRDPDRFRSIYESMASKLIDLRIEIKKQ